MLTRFVGIAALSRDSFVLLILNMGGQWMSGALFYFYDGQIIPFNIIFTSIRCSL